MPECMAVAAVVWITISVSLQTMNPLTTVTSIQAFNYFNSKSSYKWTPKYIACRLQCRKFTSSIVTSL
jgi:hypothetical protein